MITTTQLQNAENKQVDLRGWLGSFLSELGL